MSVWDGAAEWAAGEIREGRALHRLVAELDDEQRESLRRVALVVLRPHALEAGDGAAIVRALADEHGARTVAIRVYPRLEPALVGALYARQAKIPRGRLWLQEAAFGSGPAAVLLVVSDEAPEPSLTAVIFARKGPSFTLEPAPDSLRARFGRTSSLHAVLHVPDDERNLVIEASLFFGWETIVDAAGTPTLGSDVVEPLVTLEPKPGTLAFHAVLKVKLRILAAVTAATGGHELAPLRDLTVRADADLAALEYLAQREAMLAFCEAERPLLDDAIDAHGGDPARLLGASWLLSGHDVCGDEDVDQVLGALEAGDVPLSASQRSLLATALTTDLNPAARVGGERLWPLGPDPAA